MGYNKVNEDVFDLVKKLLDAGLKKTQVTKVTGLSNCTVSNIEQSVNIDDYREIVSRQFERKRVYDEAKRLEIVKPSTVGKKGYTVTMVINVDAEHDNVVAPLTALISNMFDPTNVAVEVQHSDD